MDICTETSIFNFNRLFQIGLRYLDQRQALVNAAVAVLPGAPDLSILFRFWPNSLFLNCLIWSRWASHAASCVQLANTLLFLCYGRHPSVSGVHFFWSPLSFPRESESVKSSTYFPRLPPEFWVCCRFQAQTRSVLSPTPSCLGGQSWRLELHHEQQSNNFQVITLLFISKYSDHVDSFRELLWHSFTELLIFLLPIISSSKLKAKIRWKEPSAIPPNFGLTQSSF